MGWILGHRRQLLIGYLVLIHLLLYLSLMGRTSADIDAKQAALVPAGGSSVQLVLD